jgi:hypothetical protein
VDNKLPRNCYLGYNYSKDMQTFINILLDLITRIDRGIFTIMKEAKEDEENDFFLEDEFKEGDMRGDITVVVKQDVPFYLAAQLLKEFDEELNMLYIKKVGNDYYRVEMEEDLICVDKMTNNEQVDQPY